MSTIILDARRVKAFEVLQEMGKRTGKDTAFLDSLWEELCLDQPLFSEFVYFLENQSFFDGLKCRGYGLTDLYFYLMRRYEISFDIGKNMDDCDKQLLVLDTFMMMAKMQKDPEPYIRHLEKDMGMDTL